jgi:hypothetical protein
MMRLSLHALDLGRPRLTKGRPAAQGHYALRHHVRGCGRPSRGPAAWAGFIGATLTVVGAVMLAAEKGAESLTISALDTLPAKEFAQLVPGLVPIFSHQGWMVLEWVILLIPLGMVILAIALFATKVIPRRQSALLLAICLLGIPDGVEIVNLGAAILLAVALVPYGIQLIKKRDTSERHVSRGNRKEEVMAGERALPV